jgi:hypothetical protein
VQGLVAAGAVTLATWAASSALAHDRPARVGEMAATGAVRLVSPDEGTAILTAAHLVPGHSVSGVVHLANTGDVDGGLQLTRAGISETPGLGGAKLSSMLQLTVDDVSAGAPVPVYAGSLSEVTLMRIGRLPAGQSRAYRLTATLPDSGRPAGPLAGDNALQGGSVRIDWMWQAVPLTPAVTATPAPGGSPAPAPAPAPAPSPLPVRGGKPAASVLTLRIPWQRVMTTRGITVWATCDRMCRLTFTAKVQTAPRHGRARTAMALKVFRVAGSRRTLEPGREQRIKLRLTPRAVIRLHSVLLKRGRAAVRVDAKVRSALGTATVKRRIVIVTNRRAARHRAAQQHR